MIALCRRVRTLEAAVSAPAWSNSFFEAQNLALNRMSSPEREILKAVITHAHAAPKIDFDGDLWRRWESVFAGAVVHARCPVALSAIDMLL
ncbi:MAG: hypothetical protein ACR2I2_18330 [Bryobacteraceae bacterium]